MASAVAETLIRIRDRYLLALENDALQASHSVDGESYSLNEWRKGLLEAVAALDEQIAGLQPHAARLNQRAV